MREIQDYREQLGQWMQEIPFELFITFTLREIIPDHIFDQRIRKWAKRIIKKESIQFGYTGVINHYSRSHAHVLALVSNRADKTASDCNLKAWERQWGSGRAEVELIRSNIASAKYLSGSHNTPNNSFSLVTPFGTKLLLKKASQTEKKGLETSKMTLETGKIPPGIPIIG